MRVFDASYCLFQRWRQRFVSERVVRQQQQVADHSGHAVALDLWDDY